MGMKTNNGSLFEMRNYKVVNKNLFEMTLTIENIAKMGWKTNHSL